MSFQACKSFVRLRSTIEDILDEKQEACDAPIDWQTINSQVQKRHRQNTPSSSLNCICFYYYVLNNFKAMGFLDCFK